MTSVSEHIRRHCYRSLGMDTERMPSLSEIKANEWSSEFERLMRNRLILGRIRYGSMYAQGRTTTKSRMDYIKKQCEIYRASGNEECLVDIANIAMVEFVKHEHPKHHFRAIDDGCHVDEVGRVIETEQPQ